MILFGLEPCKVFVSHADSLDVTARIEVDIFLFFNARSTKKRLPKAGIANLAFGKTRSESIFRRQSN